MSKRDTLFAAIFAVTLFYCNLIVLGFLVNRIHLYYWESNKLFYFSLLSSLLITLFIFSIISFRRFLLFLGFRKSNKIKGNFSCFDYFNPIIGIVLELVNNFITINIQLINFSLSFYFNNLTLISSVFINVLVLVIFMQASNTMGRRLMNRSFSDGFLNCRNRPNCQLRQLYNRGNGQDQNNTAWFNYMSGTNVNVNFDLGQFWPYTSGIYFGTLGILFTDDYIRGENSMVRSVARNLRPQHQHNHQHQGSTTQASTTTQVEVNTGNLCGCHIS